MPPNNSNGPKQSSINKNPVIRDQFELLENRYAPAAEQNGMLFSPICSMSAPLQAMQALINASRSDVCAAILILIKAAGPKDPFSRHLMY